MMSMFLNPWTFVAGGLLVSTPIIIHLINRIRFRRVKWAAMEFLLKAQKRMRRRKILEQLLLLLLRCLLVFLVGVLFARYIGGCGGGDKGAETRPTTHIIILDDTPSMADHWRREDGVETTAFKEATRLITEKLMPATAEATTPQTMHVLLLSNPDKQFPEATKEVDGKKSPRTAEELHEAARVNGRYITATDDYLKTQDVSTVRRSIVSGLQRAKAILDQAPPNNTRVIHFLSDMRSVDWMSEGAIILDMIQEFKDSGIALHLVDVCYPARKIERKSPQFNDNIAIVELKPRNRVVSVNQQTEIEVRVRNNGSTELKDVRIDFYLNGQADLINTIQFPTLPANQERSQTATATFSPPGARIGTKDRPLDRFNIITAMLATPEQSGLSIDNYRHAIVEVRDALKVLVVDGRTVDGGIDLRQRPEGDSYYLRTLFMTKVQELGNIDIVQGEYAQLGKMDLRPYSTIYLMNVPNFGPTDNDNQAAVANLEKYISEGGGVGIFLGPDVKPADYNKHFYRDTEGFFPVPLPVKEPEASKPRDFFTKRILLRDSANRFHPALSGIYLDDRREPVKDDGVERFFYFLNIDVHWPVSRRGLWRDDQRVQELYCLPNDDAISAFDQRAQTLEQEIKKRYNEPKFAAARKYLDQFLKEIRETTAADQPLSMLARLMDQLLCDQINDGHESEPILRDFWAQPEMAETKKLAMDMRDEAKYGDPLYVVKRFGQGRVAVMTTDAGGTHANKKQWTDWPSLKGSPSWVVIVGEMQKYLSGGGDDSNRSVGTTVTEEFDVNRYEANVEVHFLSVDPRKAGNERRMPLIEKHIGIITMDAPAHPPTAPIDAPPLPFRLSYSDTAQPGAYLFKLTRKKAQGEPVVGGTAPKPDPLGDLDFVGVPYNVDALNEGDLHRESTDELEKHSMKSPLHNTEDLNWIDDLKQKPSDISSRRWIYLLILLFLIAEQAWAVRISYHTKPEDLEAHAPSAAAAYAHHSTPTPSPNGDSAVGAEATERV